VNNFDLAKQLLNEAEQITEEANRAFNRESWNLVIRRSQEVVELSLKGIIKAMGIEFPKQHDVGKVFARACQQKKIDISDEVIQQIKDISRSLAEERAPAFYMERQYTLQQAQEALASAKRVLQEAKKLASKLITQQDK
jgi:HEPN domain-containing protein